MTFPTLPDRTINKVGDGQFTKHTWKGSRLLSSLQTRRILLGGKKSFSAVPAEERVSPNRTLPFLVGSVPH
jgi:hypothetical protein